MEVILEDIGNSELIKPREGWSFIAYKAWIKGGISAKKRRRVYRFARRKHPFSPETTFDSKNCGSGLVLKRVPGSANLNLVHAIEHEAVTTYFFDQGHTRRIEVKGETVLFPDQRGERRIGFVLATDLAGQEEQLRASLYKTMNKMMEIMNR